MVEKSGKLHKDGVNGNGEILSPEARSLKVNQKLQEAAVLDEWRAELRDEIGRLSSISYPPLEPPVNPSSPDELDS